jgi:pantoate--beta-alanine ligase
MKVFDSMAAWRSWREGTRAPVGFVPTMGALHAGHLSLFQASHLDNPVTVASIYVNPTQFDNAADLETYPSTLEQDIQMLCDAGVDALILPGYPDLYPDDFRYKVSESELSKRFCGAHRPGHFDGVLTVVMKLLNLVSPHKAYFGEKDFQQLQLIRGMVKAFLMPVEIIGCPVVRDSDGLALSSRNQRLDTQQRALAPVLHQTISKAVDARTVILELQGAGFEVDYVEDYDGQRLAAASLGDVRLIDNVRTGN